MPRNRRTDRREFTEIANLVFDAYLSSPTIDPRSARSTRLWVESLRRASDDVTRSDLSGSSLAKTLRESLTEAAAVAADRQTTTRQVAILRERIGESIAQLFPYKELRPPWPESARRSLRARSRWELSDADDYRRRLATQIPEVVRGLGENRARERIIDSVVLNPHVPPAKRAAALLAIEHSKIIDSIQLAQLEARVEQHRIANGTDHVRQRVERDDAAQVIEGDVRTLCRLDARWTDRGGHLGQVVNRINLTLGAFYRGVIPTSADTRFQSGLISAQPRNQAEYDAFRLIVSPADTSRNQFRAAQTLLASAFDLAYTQAGTSPGPSTPEEQAAAEEFDGALAALITGYCTDHRPQGPQERGEQIVDRKDPLSPLPPPIPWSDDGPFRPVQSSSAQLDI